MSILQLVLITALAVALFMVMVGIALFLSAKHRWGHERHPYIHPENEPKRRPDGHLEL